MRYAFDIEIFKNFFSCAFVNIDQDLDEFIFICHNENIKDFSKLRNFLLNRSDLYLVGFNNAHFDDYLIRAILKGETRIEQLYLLAQDIIKETSTSEHSKANLFVSLPHVSVDLKMILAIDGSLKQVMVNLKQPKIQDLPLPYDVLIEDNQVNEIIEYNFNDVYGTKALYLAERDEIELRGEVGQLYNIDMWQSSRSRMANQILEKEYLNVVRNSSFLDQRTDRKVVKVSDCIGKNIRFETTELNKFLNKISKLKLYEKDKFRLVEEVSFAGKIFDFGIGGLHSRDDAGIFKSTEDCKVIDADVSSFYPNIMILNQIKPEHLDYAILDIFERMTRQRMDAKRTGDKVTADALKIVINSIFGKLGSNIHWLYDPQAMLSVTISGQLYLLSLIEKLYLAGIEILSANTDGIICNVDKEDEYSSVCEEWQQFTGFELEFVTYDIYARRDIINYITRINEEKVKIKEKGIFKTSIQVTKGYRFPIISKALRAYLLDGIAPEKFILSHTDIYDFMASQRTGIKFNIFSQNGTKTSQLQKTNRYLVSTNGTRLFKRTDDKEIELCAGEAVRVVNNYLGEPIESFNIKYEFYSEEVRKILYQIKPPIIQEALF